MEKGIFKTSLSLYKKLLESMFNDKKVAILITSLVLFLFAKHTFIMSIDLENLSFKIFVNGVVLFIIFNLFQLLIARVLIDLIRGNDLFYNFDLDCIVEAVKRFFITLIFGIAISVLLLILYLPLYLLQLYGNPVASFAAIILAALVQITISMWFLVARSSFSTTSVIKHHYSFTRWLSLVAKNKLNSLRFLMVLFLLISANFVILFTINYLNGDLNQWLIDRKASKEILTHLFFPNNRCLASLYDLMIAITTSVILVVFIKKLLDSQADGWEGGAVHKSTSPSLDEKENPGK